MQMLLVKFHSGLSDADVMRNLEERLPLFGAVPGLVQKYYAREAATGDYVGVYLFESEDALQQYRASDVARSIPLVYEVQGTPRVEVLDFLFSLHPETPARAS